MAKIETVVLRRFIDPVNEASAAHREAIKGLNGLMGLTPKAREKVILQCTSAESAYKVAVDELVGGLNKLIEDAEAGALQQ